jgi:hypothetical protein
MPGVRLPPVPKNEEARHADSAGQIAGGEWADAGDARGGRIHAGYSGAGKHGV